MELLVLDDLSATKTSPWALEQLYLIVNRRYNDSRATIITTDLTSDELARRFGYRMVRRLRDMTGRKVDFDATDDDVADEFAVDSEEDQTLTASRLGRAAEGPVVVDDSLELGTKLA